MNDQHPSRVASLLLAAIIAPLAAVLALAWHVASIHGSYDHHHPSPFTASTVAVHGHEGSGHDASGHRHAHDHGSHADDTQGVPAPGIGAQGHHRCHDVGDHRHRLIVPTSEGIRVNGPSTPVFPGGVKPRFARQAQPTWGVRWSAETGVTRAPPSLSSLCTLLL